MINTSIIIPAPNTHCNPLRLISGSEKSWYIEKPEAERVMKEEGKREENVIYMSVPSSKPLW